MEEFLVKGESFVPGGANIDENNSDKFRRAKSWQIFSSTIVICKILGVGNH